ncbi:hypothetical protein [Nostoc sphaeroides]|uniref:Uncharacterized protein n=1 Tax=Nostoc sphaeroides CCNUC1 TaxID=2653204 RepID=A0A5P8VRQ6_9NOSO|nr:hypothetical protein [Nostoc sphaeroides]QFS43102.1 hypothetical protein GXM_00575 [Nostoc sphaeroides CCNUC1]
MSDSETQQTRQMLGFVPQPNLRVSRFLALTEPYWTIPRLLKFDLSIEQIAQALELNVEQVRQAIEKQGEEGTGSNS